MTLKEIHHLYWRAGFGILPKEAAYLSSKSRKEVVGQLMKDSKEITPLYIDLSEIESMIGPGLAKDKNKLRTFVNKGKIKVRELNTIWFDRLTSGKNLLRERMTLFWANHFVVRENNAIFVRQYNNTLREHALGNFGDFVKAISKEPAMLKFLNNKQNIKRSPNENFARELMELFTLGAGNYTEKDIKESARAFTGYFHGPRGAFHLRVNHHDNEIKTFFGKRGRFDGDDIIDIILSQRQCARFICEKIYKNFVNEKLVESHIEQMTDKFYRNYDIGKLMEFIFSSDWFYDERNFGAKIKSPIEFLAGLHKVVPYTFNNKLQLYGIQRLLGQILFDPPNVAGWPGGRSWINSNTMLLRMRLPSLLLSGAHISTQREGQLDGKLADLMRKKIGAKNKFNVERDWERFDDSFSGVAIDQFTEEILQCEMNKGTFSLLDKLEKSSKRDLCIQLVSLPEYQMC